MIISVKILLIIIQIFAIGILLKALIFRTKKAINLYECFYLGFTIVGFLGTLLFQLDHFRYINIIVTFALVLSLSVLLFKKQIISLDIIKHFDYKYLILFVLIIFLSIVMRLPVSNFIFMIGDPGEYINSGNMLAMSGTSGSSFFPLTQVWLGFFSLMLGKAYSSYCMLLFSVLTSVAFYLLLGLIFQKRKLSFLGLVIISINILSVWTARMPYSEVLMLFWNINIVLFYIKFIRSLNQQGNRVEMLFYLLLVMLSIGSASLTRVTGIVWMAIMTVNFLVQLCFIRKNLKQHWLLWNGAFVTYLFSVYHGLKFAAFYYMGWQLVKIIPDVNETKVIVLHVFWFVIINLFYFIFKNSERFFLRFKMTYRSIGNSIKGNPPYLFLSVLVFLFLYMIGEYFFVKDIKLLSVVNFFRDTINGNISSNRFFYYFNNYFTVMSFVLIPLGFIYLIKNYNPFVKKELSLLWIYVLITLVYYSKAYTMATGVSLYTNHLFYLYYDRYFYSDPYFIYLIFFISSFDYVIEHE